MHACSLSVRRWAVISTLIPVFVMASGCRHTAELGEAPEKTKNLPPATSRNYETFKLEKELARARTTQTSCLVLGITGAVAAAASFATDAGVAAWAPAMGASGTGFVCAQYNEFIAERAKFYLNGAGVTISF